MGLNQHQDHQPQQTERLFFSLRRLKVSHTQTKNEFLLYSITFWDKSTRQQQPHGTTSPTDDAITGNKLFIFEYDKTFLVFREMQIHFVRLCAC